MKSVILLSYFVVLLVIICVIDGRTVNYGSLIGDVYDKHMTDSVIIVPSKNYFSFERIVILQKISKELSARGISSVVLNFMQLEQRMKFHSRKFRRPLVVIIIDEITEIHQFSEEMVNIDRGHPPQLVLFTGDSKEDHCRYCRDPLGNPFNLTINSEMVVLCCDSDYIDKWWSERENQTSKLSNGQWIEGENKLDWYAYTTVSKHRQSMDNKRLRLVIAKGFSLIWKENDQLRGYLGELLRELSQFMKFTISHIIEEDTWEGARDAIAQGKADMGIHPFSMDPQQVRAVDFTIPLISVQHAFFIGNRNTNDLAWNACFKPLHRKIWMVITILLLIIPLLLTMIEYRKNSNFFDMIAKNYLNVWGIFCQKPLLVKNYELHYSRRWNQDAHGMGESICNFPDRTPLRIVYISTYLTVVVLSAAFSASFISWLSTTTENLPFHNFKEFFHDETYTLVMMRHNPDYPILRISNHPGAKKIMAKLESPDSWPHTRREGFEQICTQKKALYDWHIAYQEHYPCEILKIIGSKRHFGLILPLKSQYTRILNNKLRRFERSGMLRRLKEKYFRTSNNTPDTLYTPVTFKTIIPILIAFAIGFSIAFIIFCIELP